MPQVALHHYATRSLAEYQAKMARGSDSALGSASALCVA